MKDASGIGSANNNFDDKNIYIKADFCNYNYVSANVMNINSMDKKMSNNINNIDASQSS